MDKHQLIQHKGQVIVLTPKYIEFYSSPFSCKDNSKFC